MAVQVKKRKAKKLRRREYRMVGTLTVPVEVSVMARTDVEADRIVRDVLDRMSPPKATRVKVGKRSRLLRDNIDYYVETGGAEIENDYTEEADDDCKILT